MVKPRLDVSQYELRGRLNLWNWADGATVITFREGHTIVFRDELLPILRRLQTNGLPAFGAIVLVLATMQDSWRLSRLALSQCELFGHYKNHPDFEQILSGLDTIHEAWNTLAPSERSKEFLAHCVFDGTPPDLIGAVVPQEVVDRLVRMIPWDLEAAPDFRMSRLLLVQDLKVLRRVSQGLRKEDIVSRVKTGVSQIIKPAEVELPETEFLAREFLRGLENDPALGELARLAAQLFPCVSLPKWVDDPDDTQQGGVSDITNRGDLDRLLLSELAQDDLTLAVRVALKESLYLRRETPPGPPQVTRVVLVDVGIRSWGVNRVFAMATGLAFALHAPARKGSRLFSGISQDLLSVDFTSREGLLAWMEKLDTEFDPLEYWTKLLAQREFAEAKFEFVLVTSAEVMADADFRARLSQVEHSFYIATTNKQGDFRLTWRTPQGQRRIREARLDLEEITSDKTVAQDQDSSDLPIAYLREHFPLRFSSALAYERTWVALSQGPHRHHHAVFSVDNHGQLLRFTTKAHGAELLTQIGSGRFHYARTFAANDLHLAIFGSLSSHGLKLIEYHFESGDCRISKLAITRPNPRHFAMDAAHVYVFHEDAVDIFHAGDGSLAKSEPLRGGMQFLSGRYLAAGDGIRQRVWGVHYVVHGLVWVEESMDHLRTTDHVVAVLEPDGGLAERVFITDRGSAIWPTTGEKWDFQKAGRTRGRGGLLARARGDRKFLYLADQLNEASLVDLDARTCVNVPAQPAIAAWKNDAFKYAQHMQMRRRFRRIAVNNQSKQLELITGREAVAFIYLLDDHLMITESQQVTAAPEAIVVGMNIPANAKIKSTNYARTAEASNYQRFESIETGYGQQLDLLRAVWPGGSEAVWDPRGFLTLRSHDQAIPECTIAVSDTGPLGGWVSDGRRFGPGYFHGPDTLGQLVPAKQVFISVIRAFMERIG